MKKSRAKVTLATISEKSGVSIPTISAILKNTKGNNSRFSPETNEKVLRVARELGYRTNRSAQSLRTNRHNAIGILVKDFWYIYETRFRGIMREAAANNQLVIMETLPDETDIMPDMISEDAVDGIILFEDIGEKIEREINRLNIPAVQVNTNSSRINAKIIFDTASAAVNAIAEFKSSERLNPAFITGAGGAYHTECEDVFMNEAVSAGMNKPQILRFDKYYEQPCFHPEVYEKTLTFISEHPEIDAAFFPNDYFAPIFYKACAELNRKIPDDIATIGCNNTTAARHVIPPLTSVCIDRELIGRTAVKMLNEILYSGAKGKCSKVFEYELLERTSS